MKKKGFTLIELLAVIVILAIIAVITVPKIADMISSSRMGGAEDSFYGTLKAAELGYTKALQSKTDLKGDTCDLSKVSGDKVTCTNGTVIAFTGKVPEKGTIVIDSSGSTIAKEVTLNGYKCYGDLSTKNPCVKTTDKVAGETLIAKGTSSGIYNDTYDTSRYVFKGDNPNNYLTFNEEEKPWRIVSVEADGTLKIIRVESLGNRAFDSRLTTTTGPRLNDQNTYCRLWTDGQYYGCNAWNAVGGSYTNNSFTGTVTKDSELKTYLNDTYYNTLKPEAKSQIQAHNFNKGSVSFGTTVSSGITQESKDSWSGNVALLRVTDWYKASNDAGCTASTNDWYVDGKTHNDYKCSLNNYLYKSDNWWWLLPPHGGTTHGVLRVDSVGCVNYTYASYSAGAVRPVMHLKANIQLTGSGTSSDPYKIS